MLCASTLSSCISASNWRFTNSNSLAFNIDASICWRLPDSYRATIHARYITGNGRTEQMFICSYEILGRMSAANTAGASDVGGGKLGVSSESGERNLQTSPVDGKIY